MTLPVPPSRLSPPQLVATLAVVALFLTAAAPTFAAVPRPVYFDQPSQISLPVGYNRNRAYPVFVLLPPTGVEASRIAARMGLDLARQREFIMILPAARSTREEYLPDFLQFVEWYETRILDDLRIVLENYSADATRVYVGGYSLGGDLSWALSVRNPHIFSGAVMAGTRTSYPATGDALAVLAERGFRASFLIGDREDPARHRGINFARARFETAGIIHRYREYSGGHVMPSATILQDEIRFVTGVERLPQPGQPPTPTHFAGTVGGPFSHTSRDRFALRVGIPVEIGIDGVAMPRDYEIRGRAEWPWDRYYLRSVAGFTTSRRSTGLREQRLRQEVVFGLGDPRGFFGGGIGWDWTRSFSDGNSYGEVDLLFLRADRNPWIIPAGSADPQRVDSLLIVRYTLPRGVGTGIPVEQVLNLRLEYLLRIADSVVVDVSGGSYTVQNRPVERVADRADALDHRIEWGVGLGIRAPSPLLWRVGHQGIAERPVGDGSFGYRGVWSVAVEYSF